MGQEPIIIHLDNGQMVRIKQVEFDTDINPDELTRIDYSNLFGEIVTISALLNRIGMFKADVECRHATEKIDLQIYEAELRKQFRSVAISEGTKMTVQDLEDKVTLDAGWQNRAKKLARYKKDCDFIDSLYWAVQSKDRKLSVLLKPLTPEEFSNELVEGVINGFEIRKFKKKLTKE